MSAHTRLKFLAVSCILAAASTASLAGAQTLPAPAGQSTSPGPAPAAAAGNTQGAGCGTVPKPASAGGASVVQATGESLQHKKWQPQGGDIEFTVKSFTAIPPDASVFVCFRWKRPGSQDNFIESPSRLDLSGDGKLLKVTTTVPNLGKGTLPFEWPDDVAKALPLVPLADVRILAIDKKKETAADVATSIGITYPAVALVFGIGTVVLALVVLYLAVGRRLKHPGILGAPWPLRIISTPSGFASISQFQILLWTFVVAVSAVYVMSLSGDLIQVTSGTLVLLGIAGAAGIGAKAHSEAQAGAAEAAATKAAGDKAAANVVAAEKGAAAAAPPADPVAAARITEEKNVAAAEADAKKTFADAAMKRANALKNPPAAQVPRWSDLIVAESERADGTVTREIDVARFQMLLFTLVTAVFVLMSVVTMYVIPEIPTGFQTLMGISNGVYLGSKIAQRL